MPVELNNLNPEITDEYLESLTLPELCDLLSDKTLALLKRIAAKNDEKSALLIYMMEVEKIQLVCQRKHPAPAKVLPGEPDNL
jgi:hypothetical protein